MWLCLSPPRAARARGHVLSAAVIAQSALQLLFVFFHATAGIELQRMVEMVKGGMSAFPYPDWLDHQWQPGQPGRLCPYQRTSG